MRILLAVLLGLGTALAASDPADARKTVRQVKGKPYSYYLASKEDPDSPECIRAYANDPTKQYAGLPCWARAAFPDRRDRR